MNSSSNTIRIGSNVFKVENEYVYAFICDLIKENDDLKNYSNDLNRQIQNNYEEFNILSMKYRARNEDVDTLDEVRNKLVDKINSYEIQICSLESENNLLKNVIKKQIEYDEIELNKFNDKISKLNDKIYKLTSENIRLTNENKKIKNDTENEKNEITLMNYEDKSELDQLIDILIERKKKEDKKIKSFNEVELVEVIDITDERVDEFNKLYKQTISYFEFIMFTFIVLISYFSFYTSF